MYKLVPIVVPNIELIPVDDSSSNEEFKELLKKFDGKDVSEEDIEKEIAKARFVKLTKRCMLESIRKNGG